MCTRKAQPAKPAAISLVPRRQEAFSFKINIYINTLIPFKKLTHASFYRSTRIKIKNIFVGRNKLRISIGCVKAFRVIQSNPRYPPPLYNGHFFSSWGTKNPCIDSCFKTVPFYNGTSLQRPLSSASEGLLYLLLYNICSTCRNRSDQ